MTQGEEARPDRGGPTAAAAQAPVWSGSARLVALAGLALATGVVLYQVDRGLWRAPGSAVFAAGLLFGTLGQWLPSFLHTLAFSLLTAAVPADRARPAYGACVAWWAVNVAFEAAQHPQLSAPLAAQLRDTFGPWWPARRLANYFLAGTFDAGDIVAATLGACVAAALLWLFHRQKEMQDA